MITLTEIAQLTGVSVSTVSRVLGGKGRISDETRKRIMAVVQEMLLKPGLITGSSRITIHDIGLVTPDRGEFYHDDPSTSLDLRSLQAEIEKTGNKPHLLEHAGIRRVSSADLGNGNNSEIDGFIIFDPPADWSVLAPLVRSGVPYIVTNGRHRDLVHNYVDTDNFSIGVRAVEYLHDLGHRSCCVLTGPMDRMTSRNRLDGVVHACDKLGVIVESDLILSGEFSMESGYSRMKEGISRRRTFTAVIAFSDFIALGAMKACKEHGLRIPADISIIGVDNIEFTQYSDPPLTTFDRHSVDVAAIVSRNMQQLIQYRSVVTSISVDLDAELVARGSCARPPSATVVRQAGAGTISSVDEPAESFPPGSPW